MYIISVSKKTLNRKRYEKSFSLNVNTKKAAGRLKIEYEVFPSVKLRFSCSSDRKPGFQNIQTIVAEAGLTNTINPHSLRHSCVT